ncbi:hypothetical protein EV193_103623 [Herbihabitans rhizosphaerae]|uniref:Uncharacterized protein n=1 Tax=Herbihabitans rhizosphaerae TaxID=1872711 RepID=A0A4Q7KZ01_9PSEU|nr:hypothetical protein [Herbihabitans rhizosphaerae]RZS41301.1 hypothetical protein EV193_103623 [Herbihabitans rhizosphaerae]
MSGDGRARKPEDAAHELLLRLAGRLSDRHLWRCRDWLAGGAIDVLARSLPLTLLRERVGITAQESLLVNAAFLQAGADAGRLSALPWVDEIADLDYTFTSESPDRVNLGDSVAVVLGATLRGRPEVKSARTSWRHGRYGDGRTEPVRVVLVTATHGYRKLTGEMQRVLRALGQHEPSVEVLPEGMAPPPYQEAALAESTPLMPELAGVS